MNDSMSEYSLLVAKSGPQEPSICDGVGGIFFKALL